MTNTPRTPSRSRFAPSQISLMLLVAAAVAAMLYLSPKAAAEKAVALPAPSPNVMAGVAPAAGPTETVVLAGGCFWGIQAVFQHTQEVLSAVSGYAGGQSSEADYEKVSTGSTGHAEAVQVVFDPKKLSYPQLLQIYFSVAHDPTQLNRQYPDTGPQYRTAVFYQSGSQKLVTERYIAQLDAAKVFPAKIVTQVTPLQGFYPAEKHHQNYATLHPESSYIARFDLPKIAQLQTMMPTLYRALPVLVQP